MYKCKTDGSFAALHSFDNDGGDLYQVAVTLGLVVLTCEVPAAVLVLALVRVTVRVHRNLQQPWARWSMY